MDMAIRVLCLSPSRTRALTASGAGAAVPRPLRAFQGTHDAETAAPCPPGQAIPMGLCRFRWSRRPGQPGLDRLDVGVRQVAEDGQGSNYYVLKVAVSGKSSWTVTLNMVSPEVVYSVSGANATYPSQYVAKLTPGSGGNTFTVTISDNGTWTWPSVSCA